MAQTVKIPIQGDAFQNVSEAALRSKSYQLINAYTDESESTVKRPGFTQLCDLGTAQPVEGLYWWAEKQWLMAVSNGNLFKVTASDGTNANLTTDALEVAATTGGKRRVSFCNDGTYLFAANGKFVYTNGTANTDYVNDADANAPTNVTHCAFHDGYILCNDGATNGVFRWSTVLVPLTWPTANFATAESSPDALLALDVHWREIFLMGTKSVETWYNDGSSPFSRLEGASTETSCGAKYSLIFIDGSWFYLDGNRRFVQIQGRQAVPISTPMDKYIQTFSDISDCLSSYIEIAGRKFVMLTFPTADKTLILDTTKLTAKSGDGWSEWGQWGGSSYSRFLGQVGAYCPDWGFNVLGSKSDGKLYKFTTDYVDDNGTAIRAIRRTAPIDHGTGQRKRSNWLRIRVRRDQYNANVTDPVLKYRYQDDNSGTWSSWASVDMGSAGDVDMYIKVYKLGMYRTRQWEFAQDERCAWTLVEVEENIEVLTN